MPDEGEARLAMLATMESIHLTLLDMRATLERMATLIDQVALGMGITVKPRETP